MCVLAGAASLSTITSGAMLQTDDFQSGNTEGWLGNLFAPPTLQPTGGPAGLDDAFLLVSSAPAPGPGSSLATHNSGTNWAGDYASVSAGSVTVDLMNPVDSPSLEMRLVLFSTELLSERWTSTASTVVPNDGIWHNYEFALAETDLTQIQGEASYSNLIGDVVRIMLRHNAGPPLDGGTPITASLGVDNVRLVSAPPMFTADFDGDGDVDDQDLAQWEGDFGQNGDSDSDGDNDSDGADYLAWQQQFGSGVPPLASTQTVPEPSSLVLLVLGFAWGVNAHPVTARKADHGPIHLPPPLLLVGGAFSRLLNALRNTTND